MVHANRAKYQFSICHRMPISFSSSSLILTYTFPDNLYWMKYFRFWSNCSIPLPVKIDACIRLTLMWIVIAPRVTNTVLIVLLSGLPFPCPVSGHRQSLCEARRCTAFSHRWNNLVSYWLWSNLFSYLALICFFVGILCVVKAAHSWWVNSIESQFIVDCRRWQIANRSASHSWFISPVASCHLENSRRQPMSPGHPIVVRRSSLFGWQQWSIRFRGP